MCFVHKKQKSSSVLFDMRKSGIIRLSRVGYSPQTVFGMNDEREFVEENMQNYSCKISRVIRFALLSIGILAVAVTIGALLFYWSLSGAGKQISHKMTMLSVTEKTDGVLQQDGGEKVQFSICVGDTVYPIVTGSSTVADALQENGIVFGANDQLSGAALEDVPQDGMSLTLVHVTTKTVTETQTLAYETRYVLDKNLLAGEYVTRTAGKTGGIHRTYKIVYENGTAVSKTLISTTRTEPVTQVIAYNEQHSFSNSRGQQVIYSTAIDGIATAYIPDGKWGYTTYVGERARPGVIAVDPSVIPLGTKVYVQSNDSYFGDYGYAIAWDIGGSIKGNKIDLFMESYDLSIQWGIRDVTIYILEDQTIDVFSLRQGNEVFIS